jgi:hypothetical protein
MWLLDRLGKRLVRHRLILGLTALVLLVGAAVLGCWWEARGEAEGSPLAIVAYSMGLLGFVFFFLAGSALRHRYGLGFFG